MLQQWQAPHTPPSLDAKVLGAARQTRWWKWILTGSIRIPVPVGILAAVAAAWLFFQSQTPPKPSVQEVNLANFQPVKELKPRIVRSYENQ
jgi:hypothetical protein